MRTTVTGQFEVTIINFFRVNSIREVNWSFSTSGDPYISQIKTYLIYQSRVVGKKLWKLKGDLRLVLVPAIDRVHQSDQHMTFKREKPGGASECPTSTFNVLQCFWLLWQSWSTISAKKTAACEKKNYIHASLFDQTRTAHTIQYGEAFYLTWMVTVFRCF